ncbi:MAG: iron ABC transporter substrate-binding protein [Nitrospinota bacterium]
MISSRKQGASSVRQFIPWLLLTVLSLGGGAPAWAAESLTIYSGRSQKLVEGLFKTFTKATGIEVRVRYAKTAALANQLFEEGDRSPADLFFAQDSGALGAIAEKGLFRSLPDSLLKKVPASFRSPMGKWVGLSGRARVLAYSTERIEESDLPKSVFGLTDPKWKGRIGLPPTNASFQAFVTAMRVRVGEEKTLAWLRGIVANEPKYYAKNTPTVRAIADGEIDVGLVNHYYLYRFIKKEGAKFPVRNYYFPDGDIGALINVAGVGILKTSRKSKLAQEFVEFALSEAGQRYFVGANNEYPVVREIRLEPARGLKNIRRIQAPDVNLGKLTGLRGTIRLLQKAGMLPR